MIETKTLRVEFTSDPADFKCKDSSIKIFENDNLICKYEGFAAEVCYSMIKDVVNANYDDGEEVEEDE